MNVSVASQIIRSVVRRVCGVNLVVGLALVFAAGPVIAPAYAQEEQPEYVVKTAFIYNFLKFTQWPNSAFAKPDAPITICTVGNDSYGNALNVLTTKHIESHPITVEHSVPIGALGKCQVVLVSGQSAAAAAIGQVRSHPVLTIGDNADFASSGGMIGLVDVDHQVRFQVNVAAFHRYGLSVSSQLLKIAILVDSAI